MHLWIITLNQFIANNDYLIYDFRMRINKFVALALKLARRKADELVMSSQIMVNGKIAKNGQDIDETKDRVETKNISGTIEKLAIVSNGAPKVLLMYKPVKIVTDRKSTRLNSSHVSQSRMPSSA